MALQDRTHSRIVTALKIVLPLCALALLSTIFLFSRNSDPTEAIPFSDRMIDRAEQQVITQPFFSGTTADGSTLSIQARSARPDAAAENAALIDGLQARISVTSGGTLTMRADSAEFDLSGDSAYFSGNVKIVSSTGYRMTTPGLDAALSRIDLRSRGPVEALGPAGRFTAGRLEIVISNDNRVQMLFTEGVKLVYDPRK